MVGSHNPAGGVRTAGAAVGRIRASLVAIGLALASLAKRAAGLVFSTANNARRTAMVGEILLNMLMGLALIAFTSLIAFFHLINESF